MNQYGQDIPIDDDSGNDRAGRWSAAMVSPGSLTGQYALVQDGYAKNGMMVASTVLNLP